MCIRDRVKQRAEETRHISLGRDQALIIEGIHGLNPLPVSYTHLLPHPARIDCEKDCCTMYLSYEQLREKLATGDKYDLAVIDRAYQLAYDAHGEQKRRSGEPYITHPVQVAALLWELGMDTDCVVAALLHDVVEDTPTSLEEVSKQFGPDVALLVDCLLYTSRCV